MTISQSKKRNIAIAFVIFIGLLFVLFQKNLKNLLPAEYSDLPFIITLLLSVVGFSGIYLYSSKNRKFAVLLIPATLIVLAIFTFLRERL